MCLIDEDVVEGEEVGCRHALMVSENQTIGNQATGSLDLSQPWDYDESVKRCRGKYLGSYRKVGKNLLEELYQAKLQLNKGPGNPGDRYTWKQYCWDAFQGYPCKEAINHWLHRYEIGEVAYSAEQQAKKQKRDLAIDVDTMMVTKSIHNGDGHYTVWLSLPEFMGQTIMQSFHV